MFIGPVQWSTRCVAGQLTEIKNAQAGLSDDRQAEAALTSTTQELADSYRDTFAPIDCS